MTFGCNGYPCYECRDAHTKENKDPPCDLGQTCPVNFIDVSEPTPVVLAAWTRYWNIQAIGWDAYWTLHPVVMDANEAEWLEHTMAVIAAAANERAQHARKQA